MLAAGVCSSYKKDTNKGDPTKGMLREEALLHLDGHSLQGRDLLQKGGASEPLFHKKVVANNDCLRRVVTALI